MSPKFSSTFLTRILGDGVTPFPPTPPPPPPTPLLATPPSWCVQEDPYVLKKADPDNVLRGNDVFEGYCVDILKALAAELNFNYTIQLVKDQVYGAPDGPGNQWTGMVKELMELVSGSQLPPPPP